MLRMKGNNKDRNPMYCLISLVILGFLGLHLAAGFSGNWRFGSYYWPFLSYPLYHTPHYEGERIKTRTPIIGTWEDGTAVPITRQDLGLNHFRFEWGFVGAVHSEDREKLKVYWDMYRKRKGKRLAALRLENFPMIVTREGMKPAPQETLRIILVSDLFEGKE